MNPIPKASDILQEVVALDSTSKVSGVRSADWDEMIEKVIDQISYKKEITKPIRILNHGFVRLVDWMGDDLSIVRAARVSYDADWRAGENEKSDNRLIKYLLANSHSTPFEVVKFTFEIASPIFLLRQWFRHRKFKDNLGYEEYWTYNELSARYKELAEEYFIPELHTITTQSTDNKQGRTNEQHPDAANIRVSIAAAQYASFNEYHTLIERGCPRELARVVLPLGTYTRLFGTIDLHNLFGFLKLRIHSHAQYEIRVYAKAILDIIEHIVPVSVKHWKEINNLKTVDES